MRSVRCVRKNPFLRGKLRGHDFERMEMAPENTLKVSFSVVLFIALLVQERKQRSLFHQVE